MRRMTPQGERSFGEILKEAIRTAATTQAEVARQINVDPGQVSRWARNLQTPQPARVRELEELLKCDFSSALSANDVSYELYVSAPITGLGKQHLREHHDAIAPVVVSLRKHVPLLYWPGEDIRDSTHLKAADLATERNMRILAQCQALVYIQLGRIIHPSSSLIELGIALGRKAKVTIFMDKKVEHAYMLDGFEGVAEGLSFLPKARIYRVASAKEACEIIDRNGRELLGLDQRR